MADVKLKNAFNEELTYSNVDKVALLNTENETEIFVSERLIQNQVQADWNQTDPNAVDYIKHKPEIFEAEDELPEVGVKDNGKVLGVVEGEWNIMDAPNGEGGSSQEGVITKPISFNWSTATLPTATFDVTLNGTAYTCYKIADQVLSKEQVLNSNWTFTNSSITDETIFPMQSLTFDEENGIWGTPDGAQFTLDPNSMYNVFWDNKKYSCKSIRESATTVMLGANDYNGDGITDFSHYPFVIMDVSDESSNINVIFSSMKNSTHSVGIEKASSHEFSFFEDEILINTEDIIVYEPKETWYPYCSVNKAGEIKIPLYNITVNVPEIGTYLIVPAAISSEYLTNLSGSCSTFEEAQVDFIQSDYNENDITQPSYIKNRPFYETSSISSFLPETDITFTYDGGMYVAGNLISLTYENLWYNSNEIKVVWDGVEYICAPMDYAGLKAIGDITYAFTGINSRLEPFIMATLDGQFIIYDLATPITENTQIGATSTHTVEVSIITKQIQKINSKFFDIKNIDYETQIINKPFGMAPAGQVICDTNIRLSILGEDNNEYMSIGFPVNPVEIIDGAKYTIKIGDSLIFEGTGIAQEEAISTPNEEVVFLKNHPEMRMPLIIFVDTSNSNFLPEQTVSLKITLAEDTIKKLDAKYLPLPIVTAEDDGKILQVKDGVWTAVPVAESSIATYIDNYVNTILSNH